MSLNNKFLVRFCWGWIVLISVVTVVHTAYRSYLIIQGLTGSEVENLLNPNQLNDPDYVRYYLISFLHLIPGAILYILGPFQFMSNIRKKWKAVHKWSGYVFALAMLASGTAAISMALLFPVGGTSETISSLMFSSIMLFCLGMSMNYVWKRRINLHREWMVRAYMVALGPGTMHFIIPFFIQVGGKTIGEALPLSLWLGFTIHLILAEVWIHASKAPKKSSRKPRTSVALPPLAPAGQQWFEIRI